MHVTIQPQAETSQLLRNQHQKTYSTQRQTSSRERLAGSGTTNLSRLECLNHVMNVWQQSRDSVVNFFCSRDLEDDVVSKGVKDFCCALFSCMILWVLSFILVMLQVIEHGHFVTRNVLLFIPMWTGSLIGIGAATIISLKICTNPVLVSRERRLYMRAQGTEALYQFIDYDSLPLMRRLICWNLVLIVSFIFALVAQVLFYLWFVHAIIGLWHALVPVCILGVLYMSYLYIIEVFSRTACVVFSLVALQMVIFTVKKNDVMLSSSSWSVATMPIMLVQLIALRYILIVLANSWSGRYLLSSVQNFFLVVYSIAWLSSIAAQGILLYVDFQIIETFPTEETFQLLYSCVAILYTASISATVFCLAAVLLIRGRELANCRGFVEPLPLSRSQQGWVVSKSGREQQSLLLGNISIAKCTLAMLIAQTKTSKSTVSKSDDSFGVVVETDGFENGNRGQQLSNEKSNFEKTGIEMSPITVHSGVIVA
mmetsp:Transcript_33312/g.48244  ORF Transcript_33312/g.48244 Transcript_33312/m.48244 type:complete len:483 (-) Transcript_33312:370-1818(-)